MSTRLPTVKVARPDTRLGYAIINEADFDPKRDERYEAPAPSEPAQDAPEPEAKPQAPRYRVERKAGGWWTLTRGGDEVEKGRGTDDLDAALAALGLTPDDVEEL